MTKSSTSCSPSIRARRNSKSPTKLPLLFCTGFNLRRNKINEFRQYITEQTRDHRSCRAHECDGSFRAQFSSPTSMGRQLAEPECLPGDWPHLRWFRTPVIMYFTIKFICLGYEIITFNNNRGIGYSPMMASAVSSVAIGILIK